MDFMKTKMVVGWNNVAKKYYEGFAYRQSHIDYWKACVMSAMVNAVETTRQTISKALLSCAAGLTFVAEAI